jgi:molecular chaperone HtpG
LVNKISEYITKKVADKLTGMCKTDKENYEKYWDDISPFIKYGCLKDEKFCDKINDYILFKDINDKYTTLPELLKADEEKAEAKDENGESVDAEVVEEDKSTDSDSSEEPKDERHPVYYVTDPKQQGQYISMFKEQGQNAVILSHNIDTSFITQLEQRNPKYKFLRIDADVTDALVEESDADLSAETETLTTLFKDALGNENLKAEVSNLKSEDIASVITRDESSRRMADMMKMYSMYGMDPSMFGKGDETLVLNAKHDLVKYLIGHKDDDNAKLFAQQLYDLASLANEPLAPEKMSEFVKRSNQIMMLLAK